MSDISINTNPDSDIFENTYKYPEWYNKKKYIFYNKMLARLKKLSYVHTRSSQYYDKMNYYIFGPSITLTAISGIASFLSTSDFIDNEGQNSFGVAVGIIASISSVMQSIGGACQFSAKQEGHRSTAEQYNNLIVKTKFEIEMPNEENFADDLEVMILDIQGKCNFFPPQFIVDEYENKHRCKSHDQKELEGAFDVESTKSHIQKTNKNLSKNYNTFTHGASIEEFSIQNTHENITTPENITTHENIDQNINENLRINIKNSPIDSSVSGSINSDAVNETKINIDIQDEPHEEDNKSNDSSRSVSKV
jgi:hypothetical protein